MSRRAPSSTLTGTPLPDTTHLRSVHVEVRPSALVERSGIGSLRGLPRSFRRALAESGRQPQRWPEFGGPALALWRQANLREETRETHGFEPVKTFASNLSKNISSTIQEKR